MFVEEINDPKINVLMMYNHKIISGQYRAVCLQLAFGGSLLFLLAHCQPNGSVKATGQKGAGIVRRYQTLLCEKETLEQQTRRLWEEVSSNLDARLPVDMPPDERRNMINIRNTDLIQMFEIYPQLDTSIKNLVEKAGDQDDAIVIRLQQLRKDIETEDSNFMQFVAALEKRNPDQADTWKRQMENIIKRPCNSKKSE